MKFIYTPNKTDIIVEHENSMLKEYSRIINNYSDMFAQYGCCLEVGCIWNNCLKKSTSTSRLPFRNGYSCYIYCDVLKAGELVRYNTSDGEVNYYEASTSWNISSIVKSFFNLKVTLFVEMNDVHNEMMQLFKIVKEL